MEPGANYHVNAYFAAEPANRLPWSQRILAREARAAAFCTIPDYLLYVPRVMYAVSRAGADAPTMAMLEGAQSLPATDSAIKGWTRCIVREDADRPIAVRFTGIVGAGGKGGFPVRVFDPDRRLVIEADVPEGAHAPFTITIPEDGITGQYVIFYNARDVAD